MKHASSVATPLELPETLTYRIKRVLLGKPLVTAALHEEKLSKKTALGVLSSDCISSSAYGSEEMLIMLLPVFGLTGFGLLMPLTGVVLALLILTTLSYREVVMIYTKAGGSYVVARENFGPKVAQIASVALLIDYIVTVAVQTAAGTAAITSLIPDLSPYALEISLIVVGILAFGNLRGVREAGKAFAFPTYFFVASAGLVVLVGVARELFGDLPTIAYSSHQQGQLINAHNAHNAHHALLAFGAIYVLMKAFANGGASLTGLEAISNGVSAFKPKAGTNARRTLTTMSAILGTLVLGVSFLAWRTHATPFTSGTPTVISQVAHAVFGHGWYGNAGFIVVQIATALILYTGANTPFTGFPFLASFIAEDSFLPRQLTRRGHRLAFSTGILVLTTFTVALLLGVGAHVDKLLPFYAIGVFTGFTMAGLGMAKYHRTHRSKGWRRRASINASSGVVSAAVVLIFAVVKFSEGAWLVVLLFPIGWAVLMRLNQRYRAEARSLDLATFVRTDRKKQEAAPHYGRHNIFVLVDRLDLAVLRALRYAGSLRPSELRVVHVALDDVEAARLQQQWIDRDLCDRYPLQIIDCPDRRLVRAITELAYTSVVTDHAEVTLLLPRRSFRTLSQRLLHDRTADRIAEAAARIPHVAATIVPFDTTLAPGTADRLELRRAEAAREPTLELPAAGRLPQATSRSNGTTPIAQVRRRQKVTVCGRVRSVMLGTSAGRALEVELYDDTAGLRLLFMGRTSIPGITVGSEIQATGRAGEYSGRLAIANPLYLLLAPA